MAISDFLQEDLFVDKTFNSKKDALIHFCKLLEKNGYVKSWKQAFNLAMEREKQFPTNIGSGIGMPHILNDVVNKPVILFAKVHGLKWDENDQGDLGKVNFIFHINYNKSTGESSHMETIQELSKLLMKDSFINNLESINSISELKEIINNINNPRLEKSKNILDDKLWLSRGVIDDKNTTSKKHLIQENIEQNTPINDKLNNSNGYDVVAVTACPTGVAHTFLAKDSLEKKAKEMGVSIKVETQGTEGSRNTLTNEDIKNARGVILALDRSIDTTKFAGKENVVETSTRAAIKNPENEINKVLEGKGTTFKGNAAASNSGKLEDDNLISFNKFGKRLYRSLMNGVGHMLPFVIFGGILIAIAFMIDTFVGVPEESKKLLGSYNDAAKWFKQIGDIAFSLLVPILAAYMTFGLVGKAGLLPGFVCGFIATGGMIFKNIDGVNVPWLMDWLPMDKLEMLSNGSGFFGGIGGAILSAVVIILLSKYIFQKMPKSMNAINNILFLPLFGTLIIAGLFFLLNIPLQFVNLGFGMFLDVFSNRPELYPLLGLVMGLMMCADLGGPINKAAYVFGTIALSESTAQGNSSIPMAIAMGSGMVPPLAIALSATFDRKIWTSNQRKESYVNYILGLSFISEGAIPFTAAQPKKMIIANLVGGAVTGIAIAALRIGVLAPHGGIFVAPLYRCEWDFANTDALRIGLGISFFLGSILLGSLAEMGMIALLSRTKFGKNKELEKVNT